LPSYASGSRRFSSVVIDRASLGAVLESRGRGLPSSIPILIDDPHLAIAERSAWQSRLASLYNDCGCKAGAIGLLAAFPSLWGVFVLPTGVAPLSLRGMMLILGLPFVGAVTGKLIGLRLRSLRLLRAVLELGAVLDARSAPEAPGG
jgi:hypothetical protein